MTEQTVANTTEAQTVPQNRRYIGRTLNGLSLGVGALTLMRALPTALDGIKHNASFTALRIAAGNSACDFACGSILKETANYYSQFAKDDFREAFGIVTGGLLISGALGAAALLSNRRQNNT